MWANSSTSSKILVTFYHLKKDFSLNLHLGWPKDLLLGVPLTPVLTFLLILLYCLCLPPDHTLLGGQDTDSVALVSVAYGFLSTYLNKRKKEERKKWFQEYLSSDFCSFFGVWIYLIISKFLGRRGNAWLVYKSHVFRQVILNLGCTLHSLRSSERSRSPAISTFLQSPRWFNVHPEVKEHWISQKVLNKCVVIESFNQ